MSEFIPNKNHLREVLLFCFHLKKKAAESHRMLVEAYGKHAPSIKTCEFWFRRFKVCDFDIEDKDRPGPSNKFEDEELKKLLEKDPCQTQEKLAEVLGVSQAAVSLRLNKMGMIQKRLPEKSPTITTARENPTKLISSQDLEDMERNIAIYEVHKRAQKRKCETTSLESSSSTAKSLHIQKR